MQKYLPRCLLLLHEVPVSPLLKPIEVPMGDRMIHW